MTAIAQLAPEKQLLGRGELERVRVYEWMNWISGTLHGVAYGMVLRPERFVAREELFGDVVEMGKKSVRGCYGRFLIGVLSID